MKLQTASTNSSSEQKMLGFDEIQGMRGKLPRPAMRSSASSTKTCPGWPNAMRSKLMISLLTMRHHEAEYRLTQAELTRQLFFDELQEIHRIIRNVDGTPELKTHRRSR